MKTAFLRALILIALGASAAPVPARSANAVDFTGRTITIVVGYGVGGSYDAYARLAGRFLGRYLPGSPVVTIDNMTGAGSLRAANYLYNIAPKDGTVLAVIGQTIPVDQLLFEEAQQRFESTRFHWVGRMASGVETVIVWQTAGVQSIAQARNRELVIAAAGPSSGSAIYPLVLNNLVGTRFRVLPGYSGTNEMIVAMERGEVDGSGSVNVSTLTSNYEAFLRDGRIRVLAQASLSPHPAFPDVPTFVALGRSEAQRAVLGLFASSGDIGRAIVAPPDIPAARVAVLRTAFMRMMSDPELLAAARMMRLDISPMDGSTLQGLVAKIGNTPTAVVAAAKTAKEP
jgi:tripartite-type tricarboxylate transporter receptor subunit TctC